MKLTYEKRTSIALLALLTASPATLLADQFTVNSSADPVIVVPANCLSANLDCSLRDALAAADQVAGYDSIVFDIDDPIYLTRKLISHTPVSIDGGKNTEIRVHQGYEIVTLPDVFTEYDLPTLQPTYYGKNGFGKVMLELYGDGSEVTNLLMDGSITAPVGEQAVERIDFDSDGSTDFVLHTVENEGEVHWLIAGGILAYFDVVECPWDTNFGSIATTGSVTVKSNVLRNMDNSAIKVDFYSDIVIADNEISGGGVGLPGAASDGIELYCGGGAVVTDNLITQYRNGIALSTAAAATISGNEAHGNFVGINVETPLSWDGFHMIENNTVQGNDIFGMLLIGLTDSVIERNMATENGSNPFDQGGILLGGNVGNTVIENDTSHNSGFGMVLDRSWLNVFTDNRSSDNGGGGLILVNDAQHNQFQSNNIRRNGSGFVLAVTEAGQPFPSNNAFEANESQNNQEFDVVDYDPVCNDAWTENKFKTVASAAPACIK